MCSASILARPDSSHDTGPMTLQIIRRHASDAPGSSPASPVTGLSERCDPQRPHRPNAPLHRARGAQNWQICGPRRPTESPGQPPGIGDRRDMPSCSRSRYVIGPVLGLGAQSGRSGRFERIRSAPVLADHSCSAVFARSGRAGWARHRRGPVRVLLGCRGYWVIRRTARVWPADLSRPASAAPIAVAGVRTPVWPGRRSRSSARQSALSPSITDVAA